MPRTLSLRSHPPGQDDSYCVCLAAVVFAHPDSVLSLLFYIMSQGRNDNRKTIRYLAGFTPSKLGEGRGTLYEVIKMYS